MMAKQGVKGRIVFVGSTLGYMSFIGWAGYSPAKHALIGVLFLLSNSKTLPLVSAPFCPYPASPTTQFNLGRMCYRHRLVNTYLILSLL
jgi:hypothetical protein